MTFKSRCIAAILLLSSFLILPGCGSKDTPQLSAQDAYNAAVDALIDTNFSVTITARKITQTNQVTICETSKKTIFFQNYQSEAMSVDASAEIAIGEQVITTEEFTENGTLYLSVNNSNFQAELTEDQMLSRYYISGIVTPENFQTVHTRATKDHLHIGFTDPLAPENQLLPEGAQMKDATGRATLLNNGMLAESNYAITYQNGSATVVCSTNALFHHTERSAKRDHADLSSYILVSDPDAPAELELACARLLSAAYIKAQSNSNTICEAGGLERRQEIITELDERNSGFRAQVDTTVELVNHNLQGSVSTITQTESYKDGSYHIQGGNAAEAPSVTQESMRSYCRNNLVNSLLLPQHIQSTACVDNGESYTLTFGADQHLAELLFSNAYCDLYSDSVITDALIGSYKTQKVEAHVQINKYTGLPLCTGLSYAGLTSIDESPHAFTVTIEQKYQYAQ